MQQMVSEPSILGGERRLESRKSDAQLELELGQSDARWEQWKLESQQFDARWEKNMQQLRNIIFPKSGGEVAVADKESSRESQLELPKFAGNVDFQKSTDFDRTIADDDLVQQPSSGIFKVEQLSCGRHEEMDTKSKIGVGKSAQVKEIEDADFSKVELFTPLPHNWKSTKMNGIKSESYLFSFWHNSTLELSEIANDDLVEAVEQLSGVVEEKLITSGEAFSEKEFGNYRNFSLQCCLDAKAGGGKIDHGQVKKGRELGQDKLKETERLSHARQNAPMRELAVVLPISACYSLSLPWLLNWFPRPMVKLKFMAQYGEDMGGEGNVQWAPANTGEELSDEMFEKMILDGGVVVDGKGELLEENRQRHVVVTDLRKSLVQLHHVFLDMAVMVDAQADNLNNIEENVVRAAKDVKGGTKELDHANRMKRKRTCACWIGVVVRRSYYLALKWLLDWGPKPMVKMKLGNDEAGKAWFRDSLRTRNLKGDGLLRSQKKKRNATSD